MAGKLLSNPKGFWILVTRHWLLVIGYLLLAHLSFIIRQLSPILAISPILPILPCSSRLIPKPKAFQAHDPPSRVLNLWKFDIGA